METASSVATDTVNRIILEFMRPRCVLEQGKSLSILSLPSPVVNHMYSPSKGFPSVSNSGRGRQILHANPLLCYGRFRLGASARK